MSEKEIKEPKEPAADPLAAKAKPVPQKQPGLPVAKLDEEPKPPVNRYKFNVYAIFGGEAYGPIEQIAADESEAIQRALDAGKFNSMDRAKCTYRARCLEMPKRKSDSLAAKEWRRKERGLAVV